MMLEVGLRQHRVSRNYEVTKTTFPTRRAQYPGGPNRCLSVSSPFVRPSPVNRRVAIHDFTFEACSSFTRVTACRIACPPKADFVPRLRPGQSPNQAAQ